MNGEKRGYCHWCGWQTGRRAVADYEPFCTQRCAAHWGVTSIWNLQDLALVGDEYLTGEAGNEEVIRDEDD